MINANVALVLHTENGEEPFCVIPADNFQLTLKDDKCIFSKYIA